MNVTVETWRDFCAKELSTGGPDAHLTLAVRWAITRMDPAWAFCTYIAPYCPSTGAAIEEAWDAEYMRNWPIDGVTEWFRSWWPGVAVRKDRAHPLGGGQGGTAEGLTRCLQSLATWRLEQLPLLAEADYRTCWESVRVHCWSIGRYMSIKLLEGLRHLGVIQAEMPDIRPNGAKYPRRALDLLVASAGGGPSDLEHAGNKQNVVAHINDVAAWARDLLDRPVTTFQLEVLLCNVRQAMGGRYPGRTHDSDVEHHDKVLNGGGEINDFDFYGLRRELFPAECLGEVQGWHGVRRELGATPERFHYLWCDTIHDYNRTTDLAFPAVRGRQA